MVQGPNYALAKTLQHQRAIAARANGAVCSANMAPPARTQSMLGSAQVAAALDGWRFFAPVSAFDAAAASALMAQLLVWDLRSPGSAAQPGTPVRARTRGGWAGRIAARAQLSARLPLLLVHSGDVVLRLHIILSPITCAAVLSHHDQMPTTDACMDACA